MRALMLALSLLGAACVGDREARDVVLITLDTTRADRIGSYGYDAAETPNLDGLAGEATLFEHAVAPLSVTLPSHATMFTGRNPYGHGVRYNAIHTLAETETTLAEHLKAAGFSTAGFPAAFPMAKRFGVAQGFDTYADLFEDEEAANVRRAQEERSAEEGVDLALEWWRKQSGAAPRFVWLHLYDPHWDYAPPFPFSDRFRGREYDGELAYVDREVGRFLDALREAGDFDDALIVVAADHGEGLYEHGERWHSLQVYETTLHVPFLVKAPGAGRGRRVAEPVAIVDIAPTILDYAGIVVDAAFDGISLRDAIRSGSPPPRDLYFEAMGGSIHYGWAPLAGLRRGKYKYLEGAIPELYDLERDPAELNNLASLEPQRVADLGAALDLFLDSDEGAGERAAPLDDAGKEMLIGLGYIGAGPSGGAAADGGAHPPDMVFLEQELLAAQGLVGTGDWRRANKALDHILSVDPQNRFGLYFRSRGAMNVGELETALQLAQVLRSTFPESPEGPDQMGEVLSRMGRPGEAAEVYREALLEHPDHFNMRYHRILSLVEAGRGGEALPEVEFMERAWSDHQTTAVARAVVEAAVGRPQAALAALEQAVERGLGTMAPVEGSEDFRAVRALPAYRALKDRVEQAGSEGERR